MRKRLMAVVGLMMASAVLATPAVAQQYPPEADLVTVTDTSLVSGQTFTVSARTFLEGAPVSFVFTSDPVALGSVTADASGVATLTARVPSSASPGQHTITASGNSATGPLVVSVTVTVSGAAADTPAETLALTGASDGTLMAARVAVVVLALGGVFLLVARRRRHANT